LLLVLAAPLPGAGRCDKRPPERLPPSAEGPGRVERPLFSGGSAAEGFGPAGT
jgi:hypothetical protein